MHGQPFLGDCARHSRCQPFESLELDARMLGLFRGQVFSLVSGGALKCIESVFPMGFGYPLGQWKNWVSWWSVGTVHLWINQGAPNSVLPCSLQRHCQLSALGLNAKWMQRCEQSNNAKPKIIDFQMTSCSFAQSLAGSPCSMVFISGFM